MTLNCTERDYDWQRNQRWKEEGHEVDRLDVRVPPEEEATPGLEIDLPHEMLERHLQHQIDPDPRKSGPREVQDARPIQDRPEELIPGPPSDLELQGHQGDPLARMLKDLARNMDRGKKKENSAKINGPNSLIKNVLVSQTHIFNYNY